MGSEIPIVLESILSNKTQLVGEIETAFSTNNLQSMASLVRNCPGWHTEYLPLARAISVHPITRILKSIQSQSGDYLIPDASWANIPNVDNNLPRDLCMAAIQSAEIMTYSILVDHGIPEPALQVFHSHHCVELFLYAYEAYDIGEETRLGMLGYYIKRITHNIFG
jgi:hypothetical protein